MDIVDTQVHIGPGGSAEMVAAMDALGIASVLIDEWWLGTPGHPIYLVGAGAGRTTSPTAELASWTYPGRFSYVVRVDYRDPDLRAVIRFARDAEYARALRISPGINRAELSALAAGEFDGVFAAAAEYDLPIFVMAAGHASLLTPYLKLYPDLRLILCHCGMPAAAPMRAALAQLEGLPDSASYWASYEVKSIDDAFANVLQLADHPNVALKWAHAALMFDCPGYPHPGTQPFLRRALAAFGAERVMWASDASTNMTGETWAELLFAIRTDPSLSQSDLATILGGSARQWLKWPARKPSVMPATKEQRL